MPVKSRGYVVTRKGHIRYTSGELRNRYRHRHMVDVLLADSGALYRPELVNSSNGRLSVEWDVHHMDADPSHNCYSNFLVMPHGFHSILTRLEAVWRDSWLRDHMPQHPEV